MIRAILLFEFVIVVDSRNAPTWLQKNHRKAHMNYNILKVLLYENLMKYNNMVTLTVCIMLRKLTFQTINQSINQNPWRPGVVGYPRTDASAVTAAHRCLSSATRSDDNIDSPVHSLRCYGTAAKRLDNVKIVKEKKTSTCNNNNNNFLPLVFSPWLIEYPGAKINNNNNN